MSINARTADDLFVDPLLQKLPAGAEVHDSLLIQRMRRVRHVGIHALYRSPPEAIVLVLGSAVSRRPAD